MLFKNCKFQIIHSICGKVRESWVLNRFNCWIKKTFYLFASRMCTVPHMKQQNGQTAVISFDKAIGAESFRIWICPLSNRVLKWKRVAATQGRFRFGNSVRKSSSERLGSYSPDDLNRQIPENSPLRPRLFSILAKPLRRGRSWHKDSTHIQQVHTPSMRIEGWICGPDSASP